MLSQPCKFVGRPHESPRGLFYCSNFRKSIDFVLILSFCDCLTQHDTHWFAVGSRAFRNCAGSSLFCFLGLVSQQYVFTFSLYRCVKYPFVLPNLWFCKSVHPALGGILECIIVLYFPPAIWLAILQSPKTYLRAVPSLALLPLPENP